jgi:phosphatidylinositol alpha-1,6-mannosyltransferase
MSHTLETMDVLTQTTNSDIVISQDFLPMIGGAHLWLYEVYRRWPSKVKVVTEKCESNQEILQKQIQFDRQCNGNLQIYREDIHIEQINLASFQLWIKYLKILKLIKTLDNKKTANLHCLKAFPEGFSGLLYKKRVSKRSKLIIYAHGEEILITNTSRQLRWLAIYVYKNADLIIANSENTKRLVLSLCPNARITCIHPGVNAKIYRKPNIEVYEYRHKWNWPAETVVICTIARMEARKNHATVIRAIGNLRRKGFPVAYVCGSEGLEKERLIRLTDELNIAKWIYFTGTLSENEKILTYAASDIHAMPSIQVGEMIEGFGIVFLEAGAAGKPSIAGRSGGQAEAVLDGKTGFVVDGTKIEEITRGIRTLTEDKSLRERMGREGLKWAAEHDWKKVLVKTYEAINGNLKYS